MIINDYEKNPSQIWKTDWIFYTFSGGEFIVPNVVCKRIPVQFILNEGRTYQSMTNVLSKHCRLSALFQKELQRDKVTKLLKFKIIYKQFISLTN
jgi:hypothetical protein